MIDSLKPHETRHTPVQNHNSIPRTRPRRRLRLLLVLVFLFILGSGALVGGKLWHTAQQILDRGPNPVSFGEFLLAADKPLIGEADGVVRILLLGIGGAEHQGGTLTDTIILATIKVGENPEDTNVGLVSIPRDLYVEIPKYGYRKINSAHAFAELNEEGSGGRVAAETVSRIIGHEVPYYATIDFDGFSKIIDELGGIEINVTEGFTDYRYPDGKNGYLAPLTFEEGIQTMDGERTLQYVRSRHGNNNQGSDFARARRQQQVIKAVWDKLKDFRIITNLSLVNRLLGEIGDNFRTNLELYEMKRLYDIGKDIKQENIYSTTLDQESGILCSEILEESGAYILKPCIGLGNYRTIRSVIDNQFAEVQARVSNASIEIQNAAGTPLLATRVKEFIQQDELEITAVNFTGEARYIETIIYDNTGGAKNDTLSYLQDTLNARVAASKFPFQTQSTNPDFVIVIANDVEEELP